VRKKILPIVAVLVLIAAGFYAWWVTRTAPGAQAAITPKQAPPEVAVNGFVPKPLVRTRPKLYMGPAFDPQKKYPPGTYTPAGFAEDYRERVQREFSHFISSRLGKELDEERAKRVAAAQNKFWDEHGPNVDLLAQGKITQPEFSDRTHRINIAMDTELESIFTDDEYQKVFDVPKGTDTFYVMAHSKEEQPGMKFVPEKPGEGPAPNLSVLATPHPTEASETDDPPPPPSSNKYPKSPAGPAPPGK
jgi:hypothetical protein